MAAYVKMSVIFLDWITVYAGTVTVPVYVPCPPICLSTSRITLGKFWEPLASVSQSLHKSHLWAQMFNGCVCVCL